MTFHIVRMNEKIEKIALNYQLDIDEIKEVNKYIKDWNHLIPGTKLRLPEISNSLNEELDNEEPFIEEYYPKLNYQPYEQNQQKPIEEHTELPQPEQNMSQVEVDAKKQGVVLPNTHYFYPNQNYYYNYNYPYIMYPNQNQRRQPKRK